MIYHFKLWLNQYDPYGFRHVSSAQALFVILGLFLINFCFSIPDFEKVFCLPGFGFIAVGMESGFHNRLRNMAVFFMMTITYSIVLSIVQAYLYLLVLTVGLSISLLYALSKKFPFLLTMIPSSHLVANTFLILPFGGDWSHIYVFIFNSLFIFIITMATMYLFPEIYFLRIWLKSLQLTLKEMGNKLEHLDQQATQLHSLNFSNMIHMQEFAHVFSSKKYKRIVTRISLRFVNFYTFILALLYQYENIQPHEVEELKSAFHLFQQAISNYQPIQLKFSHSQHLNLIILQKQLTLASREWNQLCTKI